MFTRSLRATTPLTGLGQRWFLSMAQTRPNPIVRVLPSLTDLAFLMPIVFLFARMEGAKTMLGDGDTGWHVRTGEWIIANGRVPDKDVFSFTKAGDPWYAWEWLWDVTFAWLYSHGGLATVVLASIIVLAVTFVLLLQLLRRRCDNPLIVMGVTFLACAASAIHWLARPHLFTMLLTVILMSILDRVQKGRTNLLWLLPPLTILWTNLHGGFFVEFIILAAFLAGEIARALFAGEGGERLAARASAKRYALTALGCLAGTFVNPYTYHLHAHIIQFFREPYHIQNIAEYQSANFHEPAALYLEFTVLLSVVSAIWFLVKRRDFVPLVLLCGWAHLAVFAARNVPLFGLVAAPYIAPAMAEMLEALAEARVALWVRRTAASFREIGFEFSETDRLWRLHVVSIAAVVALALLMTSPAATGKLKAEYDPQRYPEKALNLLLANPQARVFADDEWGDYLIYKLSPYNHKVFVDGRDDFYGEKFEEKYLDVMTVHYDWEQYLRQYRIDTVLLSTKSALATVMKESGHWRAVYDDTVAIVFASVPDRAPENQSASTAAPGVDQRDRRITSAVGRNHKVAAHETSTKRSMTT